jgi:hypothetical protein
VEVRINAKWREGEGEGGGGRDIPNTLEGCCKVMVILKAVLKQFAVKPQTL